jgi:predicted metal-dependent phosphotriesterase family hydrolase
MIGRSLTPPEEERIIRLQREIKEGIAAQAVLAASVRKKQQELKALLAKKNNHPWQHR